MFSLNSSLKLIRSIHLPQLIRFDLIHKSSINCSVKYVRNENSYFKEIYSNDLQFPKLEPLIKNAKIIEDNNISTFNNVVNIDEIKNSKLLPFIKEFAISLKDKEIDSIIYVLNRIRESKFKHLTSGIYYLVSSLDESLTRYLEAENVIESDKFGTFFQIALLFDEIGLQSWSKFTTKLVFKSLNNFALFENKENLLRLFYIWNLSRKQMESDKSILIELQVTKFLHCNQINLKELSLVCLGFHKTKTKFQTNLIEQITDKLINELDIVQDPICVAGILKGIFSSDYKIDIGRLDKLTDKILNHKIFSGEFLVLVKLLALKRRYRNYDEKLINITLDLFVKQENVRIKELSRLLLNLLFFDVQLNSKQIGKFNDQFEHFKSNYVVYRIEYLLSVFALASHGLIRKEEVYNIFEPEFIKIIRTKYSDSSFYFINLNNILKVHGGSNYKDIAFKDKDLLRYFKNFNTINKNEIYDKFKKFEHYPSKLYLCYKMIKESLEDGRVHLVHVLPGSKYPNIVITKKKTILKDYQFEVSLNSVVNLQLIRLPSSELYCDKGKKRLSGFYKLENDLLKQMGFKIYELDNDLISHTQNELKSYLNEQILSKLENLN